MPFAADSQVEIINTWDDGDSFLTKRTRKSGKERYRLEVRSEPILANFDSMVLGAGPAQAITEVLRTQIRGITEHASAGTIKLRQRAAEAFRRGEAWALKRYSGGKMGAMPPRPESPFLFNDSDRLAKGIIATQNRTDMTYTIDVAANRLDEKTFDNVGKFTEMVAKLKRLVPALDPKHLASNRDVENAVRASIRDLITKAESIQAAKLKQLAIARKQALVAAGRFVFEGITGRI